MKRASVVLSALVALVGPAIAFAEDFWPQALTATDVAAAPAIEALWLPIEEVTASASIDLVSPPCDKTWCSERRFECKEDCLPCGFQFTCYVLQCSYSCQCIC